MFSVFIRARGFAAAAAVVVCVRGVACPCLLVFPGGCTRLCAPCLAGRQHAAGSTDVEEEEEEEEEQFWD